MLLNVVNIVEPNTIMRPHETGTTRTYLLRKVPNTPIFWKRILCICCGSVLSLVLILLPDSYFDSLRSMAVLLGALLSGETATKIDPSLP